MQHRFRCSATKPTAGWPEQTNGVAQFTDSLSPDRATAMKERAILTVSIPIPTPQIETKGWQWLSGVPEYNDDETWVIDGSRRFASHHCLSTTGCGVAVISRDNRLLAYGWATPPPWVKTAGAAEAWALLLTLRARVVPPRIITDCYALVNAATAGPAAATGPKRPTARIWAEISDLLGRDFASLRANLIWMPAHKAISNLDGKRKSDGKQVSTSEWRANQLADVLAKRGATQNQLRKDADKHILAAGRALEHHAAVLGAVTRAANNLTVTATNADGKVITIIKRDTSSHKPAPKKPGAERPPMPNSEGSSPPAAAPPCIAETGLMVAASLPTRSETKKQERRQHAVAAAAAQADQLASAVACAATSSRPPPTSAAERMAALRRRCGL